MDFAESLSDVLSELSNVCLSGGADGSDLQWGVQAGKLGHHVIHWSFQGHRSQAPESELVRLTEEQLAAANGALERANASLKRRWPSNSESTNNLLRRNWYQIKDTNALYAVAELKGGVWQGGTAWAIQMYLDRFLIDLEPMDNCKAYVFNNATRRWYTWERTKWVLMLSRPPVPTGIWTGIGTRELTALDRVEIRKTMGTYVMDAQQLASIYPIIEEPKVDDVIFVPDRKIPGKGSLNRLGGWATIRRISTADRTWISVVEFGDNEEIDWSLIKDQQIELRSKHGINRAMAKPDFTPENNQKV